MSGFTGLGETIRAAGPLAPSDTCSRPHPGRPVPPVEQPIRPHRTGQRTVGFWLIATLATLGAVAALSAHTLAQHLDARTDQEIAMLSAGATERVPARTPAPALAETSTLDKRILDKNLLILVLDDRGEVVERHPGSDGLPAFPALTPARLKAYAARANPAAFGESYRAKVVRTNAVRAPGTGRDQEGGVGGEGDKAGEGEGGGGYIVTARSVADDRRAVARLLQFETAAALPLLASVLIGARRLGRREVRERRDGERRLREFMAAAGHELRNPLTTISGYAELARAGDPTHEPMRQEALGRIATEVGRMSTLIDELVLLTRLDLGQPLQLTRVDLAQLCRDAASAARDCHPGHPVRLLLAPGDHTVTGDPLRLHQLVANLLVNARVHTPPGTTTTLGLGTEDGHRVIEVLDDGPGIPGELRARLFDPFVRGEETRAAGSGLGLSIVASIATAHGGTVTLEPSHPSHRGAWFRVRIPASASVSVSVSVSASA
ncbi:HAMP domain-containing histidine kinase [Streptomyces phaeolivaceus]|uniref:histidine kinase n=1 Tax=Streptomyces phaeolivaceus TaxID=2653200 RepID=A0A5P8K691_9ACTN|nr:HAMP domain-containing sensor histidine kinase [Streptomyces phaeolivaceus]QFQ98843.1 HAMP domain-containing histidine kinase [Streptomyces phaeolivaceus]